MRSRVVVLAALALGVATSALAQGQPVIRLSLDDAVTRAMAASHRLAETRARELAARAGVSVRESADKPTVAASAGYTRTNHVLEFVVPGPDGIPRVLYPDVPNNYQSRLELQWPIYTGGRTDALERAARAEADAVAAEVLVAQADLRLEVTRAYWALVTANAALTVLEQGVARTQAHVTDVDQRFRAGLIPPNEPASAMAQEARARMLAIEARTQRDVSQFDLARLIGVEVDQPIEPTADLATGTLSSPSALPDIAALIASARAGRQERRAIQRRIDAANDQRDAAAAGRRPMVQALAGIDYARPNPRIFPRVDTWDDSWDVGVGVSWSLWDGGRTTAEVAQASALTEAVRQRLAEFDSVLGVEVRQRALEIGSALAEVDAATSGVTAATEARRVVGERFRVGAIPAIEVLDAEFAQQQAELDRTRAQALVRLAEARLARAIGQ